MFDFSNKKILFIGPKTFNYELEIKKELEALGAEVIYFNDKPFKNLILVIILRLFPKVLWRISTFFYKRKINNYPTNYFHEIFIIKGEGVSPSLLKWLRKSNPNARFTLYLWDSISNIRHVSSKFVFFDKILSFDPEDCTKIKNIYYRPLFFINSYKYEESNSEGGVFFLGTLNGDRRVVVSKLALNLSPKIKFDYWLLVRSSLELVIYKTNKVFSKLFGNFFYELPSDKLIDKPMNLFEINSHIKSCSAVLDIHHPKQSGLTMRTFEVLASGKKLITTNNRIFEHEFYDSSIIEVIDRIDPKPSIDFFDREPNKISELFHEKYSCKGWLNEIFK